MKLNKKLKKEISNACSEAFTETLNQLYPNEFNDSPDQWLDFYKEIFDALTELQIKTENKILNLFKK